MKLFHEWNHFNKKRPEQAPATPRSGLAQTVGIATAGYLTF